MNGTNIPIVDRVAKRIDTLRTQQELSIRELAKRSGIAQSALYNILQGNKIPNIYTLANICNALNISLSDFFNFDDNIIILSNIYVEAYCTLHYHYIYQNSY